MVLLFLTARDLLGFYLGGPTRLFGYGGAGYVRIVASALVLNYFNC